MKTILIFALATLTSTPTFAKKSDHPKLYGAWDLTAFLINTPGKGSASFCSDMTGQILYEKSGFMSVAINCGPSEEKKVPADDYGRMLFYSGRFKISGDDVIHTVTQSSVPSLIGKQLTRKVEALSRDTLVLTGALGSTGQTLRIEWKRDAEKSAQTTEESVTYLTHLKLKPGSEKAFLSELKNIIRFSKSEAGNIAWYVQQSTEDPTEIVFYTRWVNQAAIEWHLSTPLLKKYIANTSGLLAQPAKLTRYKPLDLKAD